MRKKGGKKRGYGEEEDLFREEREGVGGKMRKKRGRRRVYGEEQKQGRDGTA